MKRLTVRSERGLIAEPIRADLCRQITSLASLVARWEDPPEWSVTEHDR